MLRNLRCLATYEHRRQPLLPGHLFLRRMASHAVVASMFLVVSLAIGVCGYRFIEGMAWIDAVLEAAMILGGMGPVGQLRTSTGKLFAAAYAIYSGVAFLATVGVLLAPLVHRFLHRLHVESAQEK